MQKTYEVMVIIDNDRNEKDAQAFIKENILAKIKEHGGKATFEDFWGTRGFAYKINGKTWGYYFVAQFTGPTDIVKNLTTDWNITKGLVRFMMSTVDKKAPAPVKYEDMQKSWKKQAEEEGIASIETGTDAAKAAPKKDAVDAKIDKIVGTL